MTEDDITTAGDLIWAGLFFTLAIIVAVFGEPRAFALIAAGAGVITGAIIAVRAIDRR